MCRLYFVSLGKVNNPLAANKTEKAEKLAELSTSLQCSQKIIKLASADKSEAGWLAFKEYQSTEDLACESEDKIDFVKTMSSTSSDSKMNFDSEDTETYYIAEDMK